MNNKSTVKTVVTMMLITLVGKAMGLVREMMFGFYYGTGSIEASAFTVANQIPKNFLDAMFASVVSASFIPVFNEYYEKHGREAAYRLTHNFLSVILVASAAVSVAGIVFAAPIVNWYAAGFTLPAKQLSAELLRIMFPLLTISGLAYALVGVVQSLGEFSIPSAMSVVSNAVILLYYFGGIDRFGVYGLAVVFLVAWLMQLLIQLPFLRKNGFRYRFFIDLSDPGLRQIGALMLPVMLSTWVQPVNVMINSKIASQLYNGTGAGVNALNYANTLYSVIMGVFILSVANVVFPRLSRQSTNQDADGFGETLYTTLHAMFYFLIPMTVGLIVLAEPLVRLVFQIGGGQFDAFSTAITARALTFYCVGIVGFGVQTILSRGFYAMKDGLTPLLTGIAAITVNLILSLALVNRMDVGGVALASSVSISIVAGVMLVAMSRNVKLNMWKDTVQMVFAAGLMGVCAVLTRDFFAGLEDRLIVRLLTVFATAAVGVVVYFAITYALKLSEPRLVTQVNTGNTKQEASERGEGMLALYLRIYRHSGFYRLVSAITGFVMRLWHGSFFRRLFFDGWGLGFERRIVFKRLERYADESLLLGWLGKAVNGLLGICERMVEGSLILRRAGGFFGLRQFDRYSGIGLVFLTILCIPLLPTKYTLALCCLSVAGFGLRWLFGKAEIRFSTIDFFVALFAALIAVSIAISYIPSNSAVMGSVYILFILFYFVVKNSVDTREKLFAVLSAVLLAGFVVAALGILQKLTGRNFTITESWIDTEMFGGAARVYATLDNPNVLGEYLIFVTMLAFAGIYYFKNWFYKFVSLGICGAAGLCLVYSLSRGAWLGIIFAFALFALIRDRRLIWLGLLGLLFLPLFMPDALLERLLSIGNLQDSSSTYRLHIWQASLNMARDYWPIGIGLGTRVFIYIYQKFAFAAAYAEHAHNLYLQMVIDLGISGIFLFACTIFMFFRNYLSRVKHTRDELLISAGAALCAAMGGYLVQGLTDNVWYNYRIVVFFWVILALCSALARLMTPIPAADAINTDETAPPSGSAIREENDCEKV